jgi:hypothetical protein
MACRQGADELLKPQAWALYQFQTQKKEAHWASLIKPSPEFTGQV